MLLTSGVRFEKCLANVQPIYKTLVPVLVDLAKMLVSDVQDLLVVRKDEEALWVMDEM